MDFRLLISLFDLGAIELHMNMTNKQTMKEKQHCELWYIAYWTRTVFFIPRCRLSFFNAPLSFFLFIVFTVILFDIYLWAVLEKHEMAVHKSITFLIIEFTKISCVMMLFVLDSMSFFLLISTLFNGFPMIQRCFDIQKVKTSNMKEKKVLFVWEKEKKS